MPDFSKVPAYLLETKEQLVSERDRMENNWSEDMRPRMQTIALKSLTAFRVVLSELVINNDSMFKIIGYTDGRNECDRCGRTELKGVYVIQTNGGEIKHLGSTCVCRAFEMNEKEEGLFKKAKWSVARAKKSAKDRTSQIMRFKARRAGFLYCFRNKKAKDAYFLEMESNEDFQAFHKSRSVIYNELLKLELEMNFAYAAE